MSLTDSVTNRYLQAQERKKAALDPSRIRMSHRSMRLDEMIRQIDLPPVPLGPLDKASQLIENLIVGLPIPPFVVGMDAQGQYHMLDGAWRLTVFKDFTDHKFALEDVEYFPALEGKEWSELPRQFQRKIMQGGSSMDGFSVNIFDPSTPKEMQEKYLKQLRTYRP